MAYDKDQPIGFKIGYDRFQHGSFYSWLGSVLPAYRRMGIANALAHKQESWAIDRGYSSIRLKTRNKYKAMIAFVENSGFTLIGKIAKIPAAETRLLYEKTLT